jgi:4'-phosphopantetheinyl transferase
MPVVDCETTAGTINRVLRISDSQSVALTESGAAVPYASSTVEVISVRLDLGALAVGELAQCLSDEERLRASRFVFDRDRCRFIVGRARLRELLASRLGVRPESVELAYGGRGKPALARNFAASDLRFNLSHSEDVAVYAFACGRDVGIDVEAVRVIRDADDIAARFFSRRENQAYRALDPRDKPLGFFNCWTRKEAFIKALGDGLYHALDRFEVSLKPGEPARILNVQNTLGEDCGWCMDSFSPAPGFVAAVVTARAA